MRTLRHLQEDGLEPLGTIQLGTTIVAGDPSALVAPVGSGSWYGAAIRPGTWHLFGRPWVRDPDLLEELILVHESGIPSFYDLYDEAQQSATLDLPYRRLVVLDGGLRTDADLLKSVVEVDVEALPWVLDRGVAIGGLEEFPAQVIVPRTSEVRLLSFGLGNAPRVLPEEGMTRDGTGREDD
jgi:hypothetical protein